MRTLKFAFENNWPLETNSKTELSSHHNQLSLLVLTLFDLRAVAHFFLLQLRSLTSGAAHYGWNYQTLTKNSLGPLKLLIKGWQALEISFTLVMSLVIPIKGGLKSERAGGFARLKNIFQISLLNYYIQYVTKIRYKYN